MREGGGGGEYGPPPISPDRKNRTGEMKNWGEKLRPGVSPFSFLLRSNTGVAEIWRVRSVGNDGRNERFGGRRPAVAGIRDFREALRDGRGKHTGFWSGVGPSLHCSRRLIHCRLPQTAFRPSRPLLRPPPPSIVVARLAPFPSSFERCFA